MKVFITGAPGWLGTRFVKAMSGLIDELSTAAFIEQIDEIRCLVQPELSPKILKDLHPKIQTFSCDLTDINLLPDFFEGSKDGLFFHLAGLVHPTKGIKQLYEVNFEGAKNVLNLAIKNKVKRVVVISSNSPAGNNPSNEDLFTEDRPYNPYMNYGLSKMKMELFVKEAYSKGAIETVILRPCWFYGPDQPPRQTLFFSMIKNGKMPIVGDGESKRSMSYIDNVCLGLLLASKSEKANGQIYWIADEKPYTMNEIVNTIEKLLESEFKLKVAHKRLKLPWITGEVAQACDWTLQNLGLYQQKIHVLSEMNKTIACSIEKAKKELGYSPKISLEEGMRRSIKWCVDNGLEI